MTVIGDLLHFVHHSTLIDLRQRHWILPWVNCRRRAGGGEHGGSVPVEAIHFSRPVHARSLRGYPAPTLRPPCAAGGRQSTQAPFWRGVKLRNHWCNSCYFCYTNAYILCMLRNPVGHLRLGSAGPTCRVSTAIASQVWTLPHPSFSALEYLPSFTTSKPGWAQSMIRFHHFWCLVLPWARHRYA